MNIKMQLVPEGHPNRRGWKLETMHGYIVHSTSNVGKGTGDEWHYGWFARGWRNLVNVKTKEYEPYEVDGKTPFRRGCTHVACDADSVTQYLPYNEYAPGAGERPYPWTELDKGQKPTARWAFENRQNWRTLQVEICESGGWNEASVIMSRDWIIQDMLIRGLKVDLYKSLNPIAIDGPPKAGHVYILRHFDLTGKHCPTKMWNNAAYWEDYVKYIAAVVNGGQP